MRIEMNVKLEFDISDATLDVLAARISAKEVAIKIVDGDYEAFRDGTNERVSMPRLPSRAAILPSIESFLWHNQQIFERG
jgi:hypothetical protein